MMFYNYKYTDSKRIFFDNRNIQGRSFDLILMGDSITEGFDINRYAYCNVTYLNSGIGGDRIEYMIDRYAKDVLAYNPKKVLFMGGINDIRAILKSNNCVDTYIEKRIDDFEGVKKHIITNLEKLIVLSKDLELIICTITKINEEWVNNEYVNEQIDYINETIKGLCTENNIEVVDYNTVLSTKYNLIDMNLSNDGLHPNEKGYLEMVKLIEHHIIK